MIKINLLGEQKDRSSAYLTHSIIGVVIIFVLFIGSVSIYTLRSSLSTELEFDRMTKETQLAKLKEKTKLVEGLEQKKKVLGEKLATIALLKKRKQGPVRMLDAVSRSIPEKSWITTIHQKNEIVELTGVAVDGQTVSDFIGNIRKSSLVADADDVKTQLLMQDGVKLQQFTFPFTLANYSLPVIAEETKDAAPKKNKNKSKDKSSKDAASKEGAE